MNWIRGLTLIEVLVSLVLLTMLAVVCVPLIRDVAQRNQDPLIPLQELCGLANEVAAQPVRFGIDLSSAEAGKEEQFELSWPQHAEREPVRIIRLDATASQKPAMHAWLVFACSPPDSQQIIRYVALGSGEESSP